MIKVEVISEFTYAKFKELKDIERKNINKQAEGHLYPGDVFTCDIETVGYLTKTNPLGRAFVKIIETIPEKEVVVKEMKPVKKPTKKTTKINKVSSKKV